MTAPNTNVPKQAKRHRPALIGILVAVLSVGVILYVLGAFDWAKPDQAAREPASAETAD
ncbi:MAG: hypothetical protein AAFY35_13825 [Pseudomonadota bacterium]